MFDKLEFTGVMDKCSDNALRLASELFNNNAPDLYDRGRRAGCFLH
jgi:hypothetical protein